jgi:hypothetical protein
VGVADATATLLFDGLKMLRKTAVLAMFPDAAVTVPDTENVPAPETELGTTLMVTESEAATAFDGTSRIRASRIDTVVANQVALFIKLCCRILLYLRCRAVIQSAPRCGGMGTAGLEPAIYRCLGPLHCHIIHVAVSVWCFALEPVAMPV